MLSSSAYSAPFMEKQDPEQQQQPLVLALYKRNECEVVVTSDGYLTLIKEKTRKCLLSITVKDIVGCKENNDNGNTKTSLRYTGIHLYVYSYRTSILSHSKLRKRKVIELFINNGELPLFMNLIRSTDSVSIDKPIDIVVHSHVTDKKKRYLVFVNPKSGRGTSMKIWKNEVKVLFDDANVIYDLIITSHMNHAREVVSSMDTNKLLKYHCVVLIGGDGIIYEVINGIADRSDSDLVYASVPIAPIPGGTGNGLAKSCLYECKEDYSSINAGYLAIKGIPYHFDLADVETKKHKCKSFLILGWGLISDIDILSESMRFLGESRLYLAAVYFIAKRRLYRGRISIYTGDSSNLNSLPPLNEPIPSSTNWLTIEGDFALVLVLQTSHCSASMLSSPNSKMDDELFQIFIVQSISRSSLLNILLTFDSGEHIHHPKVKSYLTKAYRLEPLTDKGLFTLDGEVIEYSPLQAIIKKPHALIMKHNT